MTYPQAIKYLEFFINYEKIPAYPYKESLKLERIKDFLKIIGNPEDFLKCIHVAGTKGKGSTCVFIAHILREAGFRVGLYTSPHLSDFRERIRILRPKTKGQTPKTDFEGMISRKALAGLVEKLKPAIEKYNQESKYGALSFFEVYTALAFVYFKQKNTDFVVLETGLGGRLDATNAVNALICVLTPISYEHTQKLGNTLRQIAAEKAGIIKRKKEKEKRKKLTVISAPQEKEALEVIKNRCKAQGAKLYLVGRDIKYRRTGNSFCLDGLPLDALKDLKVRLIGEHQLVNASVAVGAIRLLRSFDTAIDEASIRRGLYNAAWPGRCEVLSRNPLIVLDGAQNIASAAALKKTIRDNFKYRKLILVLGISNDKDIKGVCAELFCLADEVILTRADNPRAAEPGSISPYFSGKPFKITNSVKEAKKIASKKAAKKDLILVTGSLFVVGEYRDDKRRYR